MARDGRQTGRGDGRTTTLTLAEAARRARIAPATLRRWAAQGVVPLQDGAWTPAAAAQARTVARLRERGHTLAAIRAAGDDGRLAFGYAEELLPAAEGGIPLKEAARRTGLEPALARRLLIALGYPERAIERIPQREQALLASAADALAAGLPLVALLQVARVYGQALAQIADAEVRLFHLYVHEPLMRDGVPGLEMAEQIEQLAAALLPLTSPLMDLVHQRFLRHFLEQDVVGHMELDDELGQDLGRLRVAIAFADLAGYTRLTEEIGEQKAVDVVDQFVRAVELTLPEDARLVKTIGDGAMVVCPDGAALALWAVGFQELYGERPRPRIGIHCGEMLYREGDYYGREVNRAARVLARAGAGEVLVTRPIVELAAGQLAFARVGEVRLKGFDEATELFLAGPLEA
jgi:adenylate cyclase